MVGIINRMILKNILLVFLFLSFVASSYDVKVFSPSWDKNIYFFEFTPRSNSGSQEILHCVISKHFNLLSKEIKSDLSAKNSELLLKNLKFFYYTDSDLHTHKIEVEQPTSFNIEKVDDIEKYYFMYEQLLSFEPQYECELVGYKDKNSLTNLQILGLKALTVGKIPQIDYIPFDTDVNLENKETLHCIDKGFSKPSSLNKVGFREDKIYECDQIYKEIRI